MLVSEKSKVTFLCQNKSKFQGDNSKTKYKELGHDGATELTELKHEYQR